MVSAPLAVLLELQSGFSPLHFEHAGKPILPVDVSVHCHVPEQGSEESCQLLVENQLQPVVQYGILLLGHSGDHKRSKQKIMQNVARLSGGSFQGIRDSPTPPDKVSSMSISHAQCGHTSNKDSCGSLLPRCPITHCPVCAWNPGPFCMPLMSSTKANFVGSSPEASSVMRGAHVLARREADGYYYPGHIVQEVKGSRESFLIEFDRSHALKGKVQLGLQETPLYDIVHYEDAQRQPLASGDRVLAPWEASAKRFGPGTVLRVEENEEAPLGTAHNERGVLVNFWNGQTKEVSPAQALRIPRPLSERIILELQMPLAARQMVIDSSLDYPYIVTPGYRASGHCRQGHLDCCPGSLYSTHPCVKCSWGCTSLPQCCLGAWEPTWPAGCKEQQENTFTPGASLAEGKLSEQIEEKLSELKIASSESVSREEEKKEEKRLETENAPEYVWFCSEEDHKVMETEKGPQREMAHAMADAAVNTDSWLMETDDKEEAESRQQNAETEANSEPGLSECRVAEAAVQHSQRSPSLGSSTLVPFRCQSFFAQVNQSLEQDSLTIRSALRVQRPHSTTNLPAGRSTHLPNLLKHKSITKSVLSGASEEKWKGMDFSRARIEHKRQQEEQRQLKREQQREADGTRRQLRRDSQRQRLRQRTLQGLEKQLEHKERALKHVALLQAAGAERSRKESFFREEEERKARQRLQFLKTKRLQREELQAESNERSCEKEKERLELLRSRMRSRQEMLEQESQEQDKQQKQQQAAKVRVFQKRDSSHLKMEKEGQKLRALQQYLREQNLLLLRASLLA